MSISKPMKLIALRMDEDEKARLEQLASERHITLSTALREGAKLYLGEVRENLHRKKGEPVTWLGVRRRKDGTAADDPQPPTARQAQQIRAFEKALIDRGLGSIRKSWEGGASPAVVAAAIGQWLQVMGTLYCREPSRWDLFLVDYADGYADPDVVASLRQELGHALTDGVVVNPTELLESLAGAADWLLLDLNGHEVVRRNVLVSWGVFRRDRDALRKTAFSAGAARVRAAT